MNEDYEKYLEQYNQIINNKLKNKGVYGLIALWNKTEDIRFNKLAKEIIKEVYIDLYNITNKRYSGYMENSLYSNDYYSTKTQNRLEMFNKLTPNYNMNEKYPELWYVMNRLEIKQ